MLLLFGVILPYLAAAVFLVGIAWRTLSWLRRPVLYPLTLVETADCPVCRAASVAGELVLFRSLLRSDRRLWFWAWAMHASLALILGGHVVGIAALTHQFTWLGTSPQTSERTSLVSGVLLGLVLVASLLALLDRRLTVPEVKRLSRPAEYFDLGLLLAVALTGLAMRAGMTHADLAAIRGYLGGLLSLRPSLPPVLPLFLVHFGLFNALLLYFPFSKLVHLTGALVSRALLVQPAPTYPTPGGGDAP